MAKFKFLGEIETIFHGLIHPDGSTVVAQPGEEVEVAKTIDAIAAAHPELEAVDDEAKKMVHAATEKIRIDAARVFGETGEAIEVVEGASGLVPTDPPAPAATAPAAAPSAPAPADTKAAAPETPPPAV